MTSFTFTLMAGINVHILPHRTGPLPLSSDEENTRGVQQQPYRRGNIISKGMLTSLCVCVCGWVYKCFCRSQLYATKAGLLHSNILLPHGSLWMDRHSLNIHIQAGVNK